MNTAQRLAPAEACSLDSWNLGVTAQAIEKGLRREKDADLFLWFLKFVQTVEIEVKRLRK